MNTKILSYILAIAEEKSISKAADRFYLAQPVLSMHLKRLEDSLGKPLFSRTKEGMIPTRAGVIFLNDARAILHRQSILETQLEIEQRKNRNLMRFMVDRSYYSHFIRKALPLIRKENPELQVEVTSCNAAQAKRALIYDDAEIGIFTQVGKSPEELETIDILKSRYISVFSPDYQGKTSLSGMAKALENGSTMILHDIGSTFRMLEEEHLARAGILPSFILEQHSFLAAMSLLGDGGYCGFLPEDLVAANPQLGLISGAPLFDYRAVLAYRPGANISDATLNHIVDCFEDFLKTAHSFRSKININ